DLYPLICIFLPCRRWQQILASVPKWSRIACRLTSSVWLWGQLIYGPISDRIGRKPPLYFGLCLYIVASLLCVFAQDEWSLIAARILQALGGCVGVVMARAAIRDRLDMYSAAQAFASMMIVTAIAPILAPSLGAWVLMFYEWNVIFLVLMGCGLLSLACV